MRKISLNRIEDKFPHGSDVIDRGDYSNTAVLIPLVTIRGEDHILFEQRAAHIRQGLEVCFPGGHFDPGRDENYLQTALRETREELGIQPDSLEILGHLGTLLTPRGFIVECFAAHLELENIDDLLIDSTEVEKTFTVPISWLENNRPEMFHTRVEVQSRYVEIPFRYSQGIRCSRRLVLRR